MKKILLYPLLPALLALSACAETPEEAFAKAQQEFAEHDYNAARINLANALKAKPSDPAMLLLQARTLLALGDGEGAGAALEQFSAGKAPTGELAQLAAEAALLRKNPDKALELLGAATGSEAERLRAVAALQKGNLPSAQDHFEKAVQDGGNARSFADYARFRLMSGDIAGADELAKRAAAADPGAIDTLLIGAELALRHGDLQRSLELYSKAAKSYPASLAALTGKAANTVPAETRCKPSIRTSSTWKAAAKVSPGTSSSDTQSAFARRRILARLRLSCGLMANNSGYESTGSGSVETESTRRADRSQNRETSLYKANSIKPITRERPIRYPASCMRSESGRPRTASST